MAILFNFVWELVQKKTLMMSHIASQDQVMDRFTKPMQSVYDHSTKIGSSWECASYWGGNIKHIANNYVHIIVTIKDIYNEHLDYSINLSS